MNPTTLQTLIVADEKMTLKLKKSRAMKARPWHRLSAQANRQGRQVVACIPPTTRVEIALSRDRKKVAAPFPPSDIRVVHCPERLPPGHVLRELVQNDRVIGGMTPKSSEAAASLYKIFVQGACIITNARTAEMCKLTENSFRDVNIAFANELSIICDKQGISVWELIKLANRYPRVDILQPGPSPGVGADCLAVDPWFIVCAAPDQAKLILAAREVNDSKPAWVIEKVQLAVANYLKAHLDETAKHVTIAFYELTFKPNVDNLRESPALAIAKTLVKPFEARSSPLNQNS